MPFKQAPTSASHEPTHSPARYGQCPLCGKEILEFPALSRRDNLTRICSRCGLAEAIEGYKRYGT